MEGARDGRAASTPGKFFGRDSSGRQTPIDPPITLTEPGAEIKDLGQDAALAAAGLPG